MLQGNRPCKKGVSRLTRERAMNNGGETRRCLTAPQVSVHATRRLKFSDEKNAIYRLCETLLTEKTGGNLRGELPPGRFSKQSRLT
jgi:hypothetical protein